MKVCPSCNLSQCSVGSAPFHYDLQQIGYCSKKEEASAASETFSLDVEMVSSA